MSLNDLVLLRDAGVKIDADIFAEAFHYENKHRNLGPCFECGARTFDQHELACSHATILAMPNWYELYNKLV
jgi:hypothetical protein